MRLHKGLSNGRLYLSIVEGYRDPVTKKVKTRTLRSLGYADSLAKIHDDPVAFGMRILEEMKLAAACEQTADKVAIHSNERLSESVSYNKLLGYVPLSMLYRDLRLDQFFTNQARKLDVKYDLNSIVRLLVYSRILFPGSKKKTYEGKDMYFDKSDFTLDDIYHSLGFISTLKNSLVEYVHNRIEKEKPRDLSRVYYDVTNYYFEIDEQDNLRKKGVSKEHRPDPIIQMGLLMDGDGIPITYSLFPGNTKVTKSDFRTRQVYVSREDHIQAHFLVCFVALVIARLLERRLDNEYTIGRIASSLRRATCTLMGENHYVFHHADEVTKAVLAKTGIDLEKRYRSLGEIKKVLAGANKTKTAVQS